MRKPLHEASLNHVLKSEGGAPEPGRRSALEFNPAKPENTDLQLQQALMWRNGRSTRMASPPMSLVPVGREVKPADGLAKKAAAGEKNYEFERSRQFLPPPPPPDG